MVENPPANAEDTGSIPDLGRSLKKEVTAHSSTLAWEILWTEEPARASPRGHEELDPTERIHCHFSLSCTGEGNGNPLQYSCLENPRDRGAWWAAVYGVAQSRTQLKRLSSSNSSSRVTDLEFCQVRTFFKI